MKLANPLCLALDVDTPEQALNIAKELRKEVSVLKIGPRLTNVDSTLVKKLSEIAPVFVDHKYYDIPSTMEAAVRSSFLQGASFVTIHASSGATALRKMAELEIKLNKTRWFKILAVTIVTSMDQSDLPEFVIGIPITKQVKSLSRQVFDCGLTGIVCSPHEIKEVRAISDPAFIVTPGIRTANAETGDQKRTLSAREAMRAGADLLVVGRPILNAPNRVQAASEILKELR